MCAEARHIERYLLQVEGQVWVSEARRLKALVARRGKLEMIASDSGTELTSNAVLKWAQDH